MAASNTPSRLNGAAAAHEPAGPTSTTKEEPMTWLTDPAHRRWLEGETDRLLEFSRAARHPAGGFAWLDERGRPMLDQAVELWPTCRSTRLFARGQPRGRPGCEPLVAHGVQALQGRLRDLTHGGWFSAVGEN